MDSPKSDGNAAEPSFPVSSLPAQKSPFSKFLSNLSPIQSARTSRYTPRLSESSFPATPPVFGSPGLDLQQGTRFLKRDEIADSSSNAQGQCNYSPSSSAKRHLTLGSLSLVEGSGNKSKSKHESFDKILGFSSENIWSHVLEHNVGQEASQRRQGICRNLQFEATFNKKGDAGFSCQTTSDSVSFTENGGNRIIPSHTMFQSNGSDFISMKKLTDYQISQEKHIFGNERSNYLLKDISDSLISTGREVFNHDYSMAKRQVFNHVVVFRKRETYIDESEGCKRCNCKRSKCLKLYCECFAAGIYCVDSCACENCYNKPEYEDTVSDVREQIESRNPLAFAPTVVNQANTSPNVADDQNWISPSSARHKRGCKCKRSKCLKKYCECYRAKVGCSDGCRCECCDNYFGKKSESIFGAEKWKNPSQENLNTVEVMSDHVKAGTANQFSSTWEELVNLSHLTTHSRVVPSMTLPDMGGISNVLHAQSQKGNGLQLSPGHYHWYSAPLSTTLACVSKSSHELGFTNAAYDMKGYGSSNKLKDNSNLINTLKAHSPKQKRVSPPQHQLDRSDSRSTPGLQSGPKFILQAAASSPPLTPYCNTEDRMNQMEIDSQGSSHDFKCQE
ncbi:hypothetical protein COLO4_12886 [Corchorus olitorius]|uniref:CRC domain-containing protein n=1 Tax=Corchorus olitorius TaxID=93759 RepID=A0A1R3JZ64_9ROSI|nr:hypothetical protein COLO4_12886 [Corchorus olitorius]